MTVVKPSSFIILLFSESKVESTNILLSEASRIPAFVSLKFAGD
jgi:hypothetical protein